MKHLLRYYLNKVGVANAWFDDLLVECCHEETEKPQDTVIVADNQTGKTTTLSLLFTVLQPNEQRFIQASSPNANRKFTDYFDATYLRPGVMVLEFDSGVASARAVAPKTPSATEHFLVGQVVVMDGQGGQHRRYFSIRCLRGVSLKALIYGQAPCEGLALNALESLAHVKTWVSGMQQRFRGRGDGPFAVCDFEIHDTQGVWTRHLCDAFGIDPELVNVQVQMNLREAGIKDAELFKYKDERDFLRKFMKFCLNEGESEKVVESVRQGLERIKEIPRYEKMRDALETIQKKFQPFKEASERLAQAQAAFVQEQRKGLGLKRAAEHERDLAHETMRRQAERLQNLLEACSNTERERLHALNRIRGFQDLQRGVRHRDLAEQHDREHAELLSLERRRDLLGARQMLNRLEALRAEVDEYYDLLTREKASVADLAEGVNIAGRNCKAAIALKLDEIRTELAGVDDAIKKLDEALSDLSGQGKSARRELLKANSEKEQLEHGLKAGESERAYLLEKDTLHQDESATDGLNRLDAERQALDSKMTALAEQASAIGKEIKAFEEKTADVTARLHDLGVEIADNQRRLAGEEEISKRLRESCRELGLADTMDIDLNSPLIMSGLDERRGKAREELARLHIGKEALAQDRRCIESFQVRGVDHDVTAVVEQIRAHDGDAMPYSLWLARQFPGDSAQARRLFLSDPARCSGVLVHEAKCFHALRKDSALAQSLQLTRPVVVSLPNLEAKAEPEGQFVLGPNGDALYNEKAARIFLEDLEGQLAEREQDISQTEDRRDRLDDLRAGLDAWAQEFGNGALKRMQEALAHAREDRTSQERLLEDTKTKITAVGNELRQKEKEQIRVNQEITDIRSRRETIERYKREHEDHRAEQEAQLAAVKRRIATLEQEQEDREKAAEKLAEQRRGLEKSKSPFEKSLGSLSHQSQQIRMAHEPSPGVAVTESIETLQAIYDDRYRQYGDAASGKVMEYERLLEDKEKQLQEKQQELDAKYPALTKEEIRAVKSADLAADLARLAPQLEDTARKVKSLAKKRDEVATERRTCRNIWISNKEELWPPEKMDESTATGEDVAAGLQIEEMLERDLERHLQNLVADRKVMEAAHEASSQRHSAFLVAVRSLELMEHAELAPEPFAGELDPASLTTEVDAAVKARAAAERMVETARSTAFSRHRAFRSILDDEQVRTYAQHECSIISQNGAEHFESFCEQAANVSQHLADRIRAVQQMIQDKESDIEICAKALQKLVEDGIRLLKHATAITIPQGVERIGGQPILALRKAALEQQMPLFDLMKERLRLMVRAGDSPENGQAMVADTLWHITAERDRSLQIKLLKPEPTPEGYSHVLVGKLALSGAEGITVAMMLYLVSARLRAEAHGRQVGSCGVLLMDNPFGEANKPWLVQIQRALAQAMDIQLIYFSGVKDPNTLYTFARHIHMRQSGRRERSTGRQCVEAIRLQVHEDVAA